MNLEKISSGVHESDSIYSNTQHARKATSLLVTNEPRRCVVRRATARRQAAVPSHLRIPRQNLGSDHLDEVVEGNARCSLLVDVC